MTTQQDFYDNIDGALTPEQAAQAYALAATGDTSAELENSGVPATTTATEEGKGDDGEAAEQAKGEASKGGAEAGTGEDGIDLPENAEHFNVGVLRSVSVGLGNWYQLLFSQHGVLHLFGGEFPLRYDSCSYAMHMCLAHFTAPK